MHQHMWKHGGVVALACLLALTGCSGSAGSNGEPGANGTNGTNGTNGINGTNGTNGINGTNGVNGTNGTNLTAVAKPESCAVCHGTAGADHQGTYNQYTDATKLSVAINSLVSTATGSTFTVVLTFTITGADGLPLIDKTLLKQKTFYAAQYVPADQSFSTANTWSFPGASLTATATPGQYTVTKTLAPFAPEVAANNYFIYGYVATGTPIVPPKGHYNLYPDVFNFGQWYGTTMDYASPANLSACEGCHGKPYRKHGYRMAQAGTLPDFVACKACHSDQREGTDYYAFTVRVDDPATWATWFNSGGADICPATGTQPAGCSPRLAKYTYTANLMNDTHMSHAMEFEYPQSMSNCLTCHAGKLDLILANANFTPTTCKSCHPVTANTSTQVGRAPALKTITSATATATALHGSIDFYTAGPTACTGCHGASGPGPTFAQIHSGYDKVIHSNAAGDTYKTAITTSVGTASFDAATKKVTITFTMNGVSATALVAPTVVGSLYGYDTKDFIVSGHGSQPAPDGKRNLEWTAGATGNSPRLTVTPAAAAAGTSSWTAVLDLSLWAANLADGSVKRMEIAFLPTMGLDQAAAVSATNPAIAVAGLAATFDIKGNALVTDAKSYGKGVVDTAKCNKCHDALATSFHGPNYGSAGVVGCRTCHWGGTGGSHLEMQSRSIDSYVHAIHASQAFDIKNVVFTDPVQAAVYMEKVESTYPNFTLLNCESCHVAGAYGVPNQARSMPSILSASAVLTTTDRAIGTVPSFVTGPGSRACGSCHRAGMINEDDAAMLAAFNGHTDTNGYMLDASAANNTVWADAVAKIMAIFK